MKGIAISTLISLSLLTGCIVMPAGHHGQEGVMVAPLLPQVVVLEAEPYYFYSGYHYHFVDNRWYCARSRSGPWTDLPRNRYPKEVKFKAHYRDNDHEGHRDRDYDEHRRH